MLVLLICAPAVQAQGKFAGKWDTDYGSLTMTQNGNKVTGTYHDGAASLEGTVEKNRLTFTWTETAGKGDGEFTLSEDGKSFKGKWRNQGDQTWHDWDGTYEGPDSK